MPNKPLIFRREINPGDQLPISIEELRSSGLENTRESFKLSYFCRNYTTKSDFSLEELAVSKDMKNDIARTKFWCIQSNSSSSATPEIYCAVLGDPARKIEVGSVLANLKKLTKHKPTLALLMTMLAQGKMKGVKYTEGSKYYNTLKFSNAIDHDPTVEQLIQPARTETGYCIYNTDNRVIIIEVHCFYGGTLTSSFNTEVKKGDNPDLVYLTYYCLDEIDASTVLMSIKDETVIYHPSWYSLFLLSSHVVEFLGERASTQGEEPVIIQVLQQQQIPLIANENMSVTDMPIQYSTCCDDHAKNEKAYLDALQSMTEIEVDLQAFYEEMMLCNFAKYLLDETGQFVEIFVTNVINYSTKERSLYQEFYTGFQENLDQSNRLEIIKGYFLKPKKELSFWHAFFTPAPARIELLPISTLTIPGQLILNLCKNSVKRPALVAAWGWRNQ